MNIIRTRQLIISSVVVLLLVMAAYVWAIARTPSEGPGRYIISMTDYNFAPDQMTWRVGQTVTITLINNSPVQPGKQHEFMVGRTPIKEDTVFGKAQRDGFVNPFFNSVTIRLENGRGLMMLAQGSARLTGVDPMKLLAPDMGGMQMMQMSDFMSVLMPGGQLTFSFTVPNKPGSWTYACFQQDGQHYLNGMQGVVNVIPASAS